MNILETVKYYYPSKGGMESVVKDIVEGVSAIDPSLHFTVYANSHVRCPRKEVSQLNNYEVIREKTPFIFKSQPSNIFYPSLKNLLARHDVVHHHFPFPNMEASLLVHKRMLQQKNFVLTWHANIGMTRWKWAGQLYFPFVKQLLQIARTIVVTSPQLFEQAPLLQPFEKKVRVIPVSFSPIFASGITGKQLPTGSRPKILFVGKLRKYKGIPVLIDAARDLDVELHIIGDGEEEQLLQQMIDDYNLQDRFFIHRGLDNESMLQFYRQCHLFVLPSLHEAEAFGVVQLEAMANGMPVINTRLQSGVPFVSLDEQTGFTVSPGSVDELRTAIQKIISDSNLYQRFSANSILRSKEFSREKMAASYLQIYRG